MSSRALRSVLIFASTSIAGGCAASSPPASLPTTQPTRPGTVEHETTPPTPSVAVVRTDIFDVCPAPVRTVRMENALFAASTRAAIPAQRPTAAVRVRRTRETDGSTLFTTPSDAYEVELDQQPGEAVALGEPAARQLAATLADTMPEAKGEPRLVASDVTIGSVRIAFAIDAPDVVQIESPTSTAEYDRVGLARAMATAIATIDGLRERAQNAR